MCGQGGGGRGGGRERSARDPWDSEMCSMENKATAEPRCRKAGPRDARASLQKRTGGSRRRPWRLPARLAAPAPSARFAPDAVVGDGTESLSDAHCRTAFGAVDTDPGTPVGIAWQLRAHGRQRPGFKSQPGHLFSVRPGVVSLSSLHVAAPNCGMEQ